MDTIWKAAKFAFERKFGVMDVREVGFKVLNKFMKARQVRRVLKVVLKNLRQQQARMKNKKSQAQRPP